MRRKNIVCLESLRNALLLDTMKHKRKIVPACNEKVMGSFINDVTALRGRYQGFCDNSTKAIEKSVT